MTQYSRSYARAAVAGVAGALAFAVSVGEGSGGSPTLLTAVALAGVVYPVVFGTLGATLATALDGH